jgi:hypothetical protein
LGLGVGLTTPPRKNVLLRKGCSATKGEEEVRKLRVLFLNVATAETFYSPKELQ